MSNLRVNYRRKTFSLLSECFRIFKRAFRERVHRHIADFSVLENAVLKRSLKLKSRLFKNLPRGDIVRKRLGENSDYIRFREDFIANPINVIALLRS